MVVAAAAALADLDLVPAPGFAERLIEWCVREGLDGLPEAAPAAHAA